MPTSCSRAAARSNRGPYPAAMRSSRSAPLRASASSDSPAVDDERIAAVIAALLDGRPPDATICPSDVARAAAPDHWRPLMPLVRNVGRRLARAGLLEIRQRGVRRAPDAEIKGPIRLGRVRPLAGSGRR